MVSTTTTTTTSPPSVDDLLRIRGLMAAGQFTTDGTNGRLQDKQHAITTRYGTDDYCSILCNCHYNVQHNGSRMH
ncbi:MAG TPA: hypothetical protein VFR94_00040 [Nitrososphaeraceae archaeon]|nr:hypothetical protein [Nitrososphaeraceae archaeon]